MSKRLRIMGELMVRKKKSEEGGVSVEMWEGKKSVVVLVRDTDAGKVVGLKKWNLKFKQKAEDYYERCLL